MNALHEAETALLGALIQEPELIDELFIQPHEMVADERHGLILETLKYNYEEDGTIDFVMMAQRSGKNLGKIGGVSYLYQLSSSVTSANHFDHYQAIIRNGYIQRETATAMESMAAAARMEGTDVKEQIAKARARLEELDEMAAVGSDYGLRKMSDTLEGHTAVIKERATKKGMTGAKTISREVDRMTGGHQREDYEIIAARPSMGKTAAMVCDAIRTATGGGVAAAIFSAEMKEIQITERVICALANLDSTRMRSGLFDDDDWTRYSIARDELDRLPIYITDKPDMTVQFIRSEVKKLKKKHDTIVVYVDYIQIISGGRKFNSKREEVEYVSRQLKLMARQLGVTVVALSQLSRKVEERQDKRPMMSDLGESGAIERDADIITFLYRDDYYNKESEKKNIVELIIAKGRNVGTGTVEMAFMKQVGKFVDLDRGHHGKGAA
ncbi:replicative DNA helicase [Paenibacillus harenae]|uniref:replicative DNA helicase n=1 Tax=Paenibacillus harenae TaxID=306543 RepID=UPI000409CC44|nr:replicative DNA helicase [Paenibacillus harenae]